MGRLLDSLQHALHSRDAATEQAYFIGTYSIIGAVAFVLFGMQHILVNSSSAVGYLELLFGGGFALNAAALAFGAYRHRLYIAKNILIFLIFVFLLVMLISGGISGTGIFWFFTFPVVAFFFTNAKRGALWVAALFSAASLLWWLPDSVVFLPYADVTLRQLFASLFVVTLGIFFYQVTRDRTQRHELNVEYAKSEFLTLASHQLRTPISAIGWFGEMLLAGDTGKLTKEQHEHVQQIYDSNQRLASIVDAMLIVSGLELGQLEVRPEPVKLPQLSSKLLAEQIRKYPEKQLHPIEDYADHLSDIRVDPRLTKIIFQNIFSNAIKYTPKDGKITVTITKSAEKIQPKSAGSVLVMVSDTGYGIAEGQQQQVFSKMFRAENIRAKDTDGTGLGLFIVKRILDEVGGRIWFTSKEGEGSTFFVLLPQEGMRQRRRIGHKKTLNR